MLCVCFLKGFIFINEMCLVQSKKDLDSVKFKEELWHRIS